MDGRISLEQKQQMKDIKSMNYGITNMLRKGQNPIWMQKKI
jgi:hypothetical protein